MSVIPELCPQHLSQRHPSKVAKFAEKLGSEQMPQGRIANLSSLTLLRATEAACCRASLTTWHSCSNTFFGKLIKAVVYAVRPRTEWDRRTPCLRSLQYKSSSFQDRKDMKSGFLPFLHKQMLSGLQLPFLQNNTVHPEEEGLSNPQKVFRFTKLLPAFIPLCNCRKWRATTPPFEAISFIIIPGPLTSSSPSVS